MKCQWMKGSCVMFATSRLMMRRNAQVASSYAIAEPAVYVIQFAFIRQGCARSVILLPEPWHVTHPIVRYRLPGYALSAKPAFARIMQTLFA